MTHTETSPKHSPLSPWQCRKKAERIRASPFGNFRQWRIKPVFASGSDLHYFNFANQTYTVLTLSLWKTIHYKTIQYTWSMMIKQYKSIGHCVNKHSIVYHIKGLLLKTELKFRHNISLWMLIICCVLFPLSSHNGLRERQQRQTEPERVKDKRERARERAPAA